MGKQFRQIVWLLASWFSTPPLPVASAESAQPAIPKHSPPTANQQHFARLPGGIRVFDAPEQYALSAFSWQRRGAFLLGPTDRIYLRGMVLSVKRYHAAEGDDMADIAPFDVVIGWQRMSDPTVLRQVHILQQERFYYWRVEDFPIPRHEIESSSTNVHVIPDTAIQSRQIEQLKVGDIVSLQGLLTDVKSPEGFVWSTSRVRDDAGDGACEILLLQQLSVIRQVGDD